MALDTSPHRSRRRIFSRIRAWNHFIFTCALCGILAFSLYVNFLIHRQYLFSTDSDNPEHDELQIDPKAMKSRSLGTIQCDNYGGANQTVADDMVYWYDIPTDADYANAFLTKNMEEEREQFLIFEKDPAGFNNFRMSLETIITMGISMGRTIVLPPEEPMYLWDNQGHTKQQKTRFSIHDFYHIKEALGEHFAIKIISMEDFLAQAKKEGMFRNATGHVIHPPQPETTWDKAPGKKLKKLYYWLAQHTYFLKGWDSNSCFTFWPNATDANSISQKRVEDMIEEVKLLKPHRSPGTYLGKPIPVNASVQERLAEHMGSREKLCYYNESMQNEQIVVSRHVWDAEQEEGNRFLSPFYTYHFYESWEQALWTKRFIRDHLRYHDELMCTAARVVDAIRNRVRQRGHANNPNEAFSTLHIRRGDFQSQYEATQRTANDLYNFSKGFLKPNSTIFIATDEKNKTYFEPFAKNYDICFLDDFPDALKGVNTNFYGVIDQLVAAKGDVFVGTFWSTLSAYVNRMRGYYSVRDKLPGFENGEIKSFYFLPSHKQKVMRRYFAPQGALWAHEFPTAWRNIDVLM